MYSPGTNQWAWMAGGGANSSVDQPGVYGTLGTPGPGNIPGAWAGVSSWTDANGNLWLFGGTGPEANGSVNYFNDLWEYIPTKSEWDG